MKTFIVDIPVFKCEVLFVVNCTHDQMRDYLRKSFSVQVDQSPGGTIGQMLTFQMNPWRVVWVENTKRWACVLHEIFHLVTRICYDKGIPITAHNPDGTNGDEAAAYLFEFVSQECARKIPRRLHGWLT